MVHRRSQNAIRTVRRQNAFFVVQVSTKAISYNFRNYEYSQLLTEMETDTLIGLCSFYAPDKLERRVIFQVNLTVFVTHEI